MSLSPLKEDEFLIRNIRSGEYTRINTATETLYKLNWNRVYKIVRIGGGQEDDAKMILADALVDLIQQVKKETYDPTKGKLSTLLFVIAKNKWLDELKRRYNKKDRESAFAENHESLDVSPVSPIEKQIFSKEEEQRIIHALEQLDQLCRSLFEMKYLAGIPLQVIAQKLGRKENTIRQQHKRCKEKLKSIFGQDPRIE